MADDFYEILGVARDADDEQIQKAYRRLARKYHPDLADDKDAAKAKFQKVQHAYDILSDPQKRKLFDQLGPNFEQMGRAGPGPYHTGQMPPGMDIDQIFGQRTAGARGAPGGFDEILRQVFGAGGGTQTQPRPTKGQDIEQQITVPFATSILGGKHQITLKRSSGKVENITVSIPAGIETGKKIRLRGQGQSLPTGGPRGDLLVTVKVAPHPTYARSGNNLLVTVPVTIAEAALGAKIDLATPHGMVTLTVPAGSSSGKLLRMKGLGVKTKSAAGDLIAELQIVLPQDLSQQQRDLLKSFGDIDNSNPRSQLSW